MTPNRKNKKKIDNFIEFLIGIYANWSRYTDTDDIRL